MNQSFKNMTEAYQLHHIEGTNTVLLYGYIGDDYGYDDPRMTSDLKFMTKINELLTANSDMIELRLNSQGGSVVHGAAIITAIKANQERIKVYNDGVAQSMAAQIFLACKKENRFMPANASLLIHTAIGGCWGNEYQMREYADMLHKMTQPSIDELVACTGLSEEAVIKQFFDGKDHVITAKEAVELGLIAEIANYQLPELPKQSVQQFTDPKAFFAAMQNQFQEEYLQNFQKYQPTQSSEFSNPSINHHKKMTEKELRAAVADGTITLAQITQIAAEAELAAPITRSDYKALQTELAEMKALVVQWGGQNGNPQPTATPVPPTAADAATIVEQSAQDLADEAMLKALAEDIKAGTHLG